MRSAPVQRWARFRPCEPLFVHCGDGFNDNATLTGGVVSAVTSGGGSSGLADIDPLKSGVLNVGGKARNSNFKLSIGQYH